METLIKSEIFKQDGKEFLIEVHRDAEEFIVTGFINGYKVNETRQKIDTNNNDETLNNHIINNLINLIIEDIKETDY